jgi:hypothetical protein
MIADPSRPEFVKSNERVDSSWRLGSATPLMRVVYEAGDVREVAPSASRPLNEVRPSRRLRPATGFYYLERAFAI